MNTDLDYYMLTPTHQININQPQFTDQGYFLCPDTIESKFIMFIPTYEFKKPIYKPWSFKYEFIKYYNIYLNSLKGNMGVYKIQNENKKCPLCSCKIQNKDDINQIYYIPEIHCGFSPFIIHMMKVHDYKPPEKFIEYVLLKVSESSEFNEYKFLKLEQDIMTFFINFDNYNMVENFKFINKDIGNLKYDDIGVAFNEPGYKNLFLSSTSNQIIQEFNKSLNKKYIDSEIVGSFDIENIKHGKNKFYSVKKIIIVNRINDKEIQLDNGRKAGTYFFHSEDSNKYKIDYHIHPDYLSSGSKGIKKRLITEGVLFEIFSQPDIEVFFGRLLNLENPMCSSLIFAQEGIYQYSPKLNLNPLDITQDQINITFGEINKYMDYLNNAYKLYFVSKLTDGTYKLNEDYNNIIYHEYMFFEYLKDKLSKIGIDFIFYPKELKEDGTWEYGDIYMPIMPDYKDKLKQSLQFQPHIINSSLNPFPPPPPNLIPPPFPPPYTP